MSKQYKICQSCGMPLSKDPAPMYEGKKYCGYCFKDGEFTCTDIDAQGMQKLVVEKMVEMKIPRFLAKLLSRKVPKLERWQQPK